MYFFHPLHIGWPDTYKVHCLGDLELPSNPTMLIRGILLPTGVPDAESGRVEGMCVIA